MRVNCCSAKTEEGIWEGLKLLADVFDAANNKKAQKTDIDDPERNFTGKTQENYL